MKCTAFERRTLYTLRREAATKILNIAKDRNFGLTACRKDFRCFLLYVDATNLAYCNNQVDLSQTLYYDENGNNDLT